MKILVTGGAGFIGSHVVDAYLELGHEVHIVDNLSTGRRSNINPSAVFHELDLRDTALTDLVQRERFDVVNHLAAQIDVRKSVSDPVYDASVNILGGIQLLEASQRAGVKRVIFSSTGGAIYGEQDYFPADELHPTRPLSPYGIGKRTTEHYLFYYQAVYGLPYVVLRYANVYGPRQNPHGEAGVVAIFTDGMLQGKTVLINGDGKQTRDYVFVDDVVRSNIRALSLRENEIYNVGTSLETDVTTIFTHLKTITGYTGPESHQPAKAGEQQRSVITSEKLFRETGWKPDVQLEDGLKKTVEWFRRNR